VKAEFQVVPEALEAILGASPPMVAPRRAYLYFPNEDLPSYHKTAPVIHLNNSIHRPFLYFIVLEESNIGLSVKIEV